MRARARARKAKPAPAADPPAFAFAVKDLGLVSIAELEEDPENARDHDDPRSPEAIAWSLRTYGQQKPIVLFRDQPRRVCAGSGTLRAARLLGWPKLWAVRTKLPDGEARGFAIADNRTAELSRWRPPVLEVQVATIPAIATSPLFLPVELAALTGKTTPPASSTKQVGFTATSRAPKEIACPHCGKPFTPAS